MPRLLAQMPKSSSPALAPKTRSGRRQSHSDADDHFHVNSAIHIPLPDFRSLSRADVVDVVEVGEVADAVRRDAPPVRHIDYAILPASRARNLRPCVSAGFHSLPLTKIQTIILDEQRTHPNGSDAAMHWKKQ